MVTAQCSLLILVMCSSGPEGLDLYISRVCVFVCVCLGEE